MRRLPLALAAAALLAGCQSRQIDNTLLVPPEDEVRFARDVQPLLAASCGGSGSFCHIGQRTSGVALATYEQIVTSVGEQYGGPIVVPGDAAASPIVDKIGPSPRFGVRMPAEGGPLTADQIARIAAWIDAGARND